MDDSQNVQSVEQEVEGAHSINIQMPFNPETYDLPTDFRLTNFNPDKIKGTYRLGPETKELIFAQFRSTSEEINVYQPDLQNNVIVMGTNHGASVIQTRNSQGVMMAHSSESIHPIVDDPYLYGKIAFAHASSDLYAIGIFDIDDVHMNLRIPIRMTSKETEVITPHIMNGFKTGAAEAAVNMTGGKTLLSNSIECGGYCSAVVNVGEYITPENAIHGDVLVLTKPLGTYVTAQTFLWLEEPAKWNKIKMIVTDEDVRRAYLRGIDTMCRTNRVAARLMWKHNARAAATVGGGGLHGAATYLVNKQKNDVRFNIHNIPVISKMSAISKAAGNQFNLLAGTCPEVSGGLLVVLPREQAASFCKEIEKMEGFNAWIIGMVEKGDRTVKILDKPRVIEVPAKDKEQELW